MYELKTVTKEARHEPKPVTKPGQSAKTEEALRREFDELIGLDLSNIAGDEEAKRNDESLDISNIAIDEEAKRNDESQGYVSEGDSENEDGEEAKRNDESLDISNIAIDEEAKRN